MEDKENKLEEQKKNTVTVIEKTEELETNKDDIKLKTLLEKAKEENEIIARNKKKRRMVNIRGKSMK